MPNNANIGRNKQIVEMLVRGQTPTVIRQSLGVSFGVIAGVRKRELGITTQPKPRAQKRQRKDPVRLTADEAMTDELADQDETFAGAAIFLLNDRSCHWPIGDPLKEGFRYCLEAKLVEAGSYCPDHSRMAWRPR